MADATSLLRGAAMDELKSSVAEGADAVMETITGADVRAMRAFVYPDGVVSRAEVEKLFRLNAAAKSVCPEWRDFFVEAATDYLVHQERPEGYVSEENADWLIKMISQDSVVETLTEVELLVTVLEKAKSSPERLVAFALEQVAAAVIGGKGALARVPGRLPNIVDRDEVDLIRRVLYAFAGDSNVAVTRAEAEMLLKINDASIEDRNDPAWNDLFVKAMMNFVMFVSGYQTPSREEALRHEVFLDSPNMGVGGFFSRMVSGGLSAMLGRSDDLESVEDVSRERNAEQGTAARRAEAVDDDEARWLAERLGKGGSLRGNERTLLVSLRDSAPSIAPALQPLLDKVA
ncbi:hypothetical protein [Mesorhizobium sp. IMUNJ 23232]|uniref:hypothetical protein n=1 Tax=Mesorhizobium sp. IMUNJ 23232 TaxID=3376064 RepID=UPI0037B89DF5